MLTNTYKIMHNISFVVMYINHIIYSIKTTKNTTKYNSGIVYESILFEQYFETFSLICFCSPIIFTLHLAKS